ncbi:MAG: lipopolysaccharide transport periplasmic protein LptA [Burkholderiales bacterium]|nr:lipopolysaccharide transport periplasmic protein LptA [Burkholderiales bacterium]
MTTKLSSACTTRVTAAFTSAVACVALFAAAPAVAEKADRKEKITINAVDGDADHGKGFYRLEKNVVIAQGTLRITADRGTAQTTANDNYNATLTGKPVCFRQRTDNADWAQGVADRVDYDSGKGIVELIGNATLFVGDDETRANYITYNTQTSKYEARDSKQRTSEGKGVTFVLAPRDNNEDAPASAAGTGAAAPAAPAAATAAKPVANSRAPKTKTDSPPKRNEPAFSRCA